MKNYFEGWYFKQQNNECAIALIPAIHTSENSQTASLQIVTDQDAFCIDYAINDVLLCRHRFFVALGNSHFSLGGIHLDICTKDLTAVGTLHFNSLRSPAYDIMGPFRYVPFLECRHSVFSIKHTVCGLLELNGRKIQFDNGDGYIEGDRGYSFPKRYLWSQCTFAEGSLMLSVADIPFLSGTFTGIIGIILYQGHEYRFASYLGARAVSINSGKAVVRQGNWVLTVEQLDGECKLLAAPISGAMTRYIQESISCSVHYRLSRGKEVLFDFISDCASFENEYE